MSTYRREHYLAKLRPFYNDSGLIKVITGIRRCGKSSLLITVLNELFEQGIPETNLIYLNLDRREYRNVTTPDQLDQLIVEYCRPPSDRTVISAESAPDHAGAPTHPPV